MLQQSAIVQGDGAGAGLPLRTMWARSTPPKPIECLGVCGGGRSPENPRSFFIPTQELPVFE